MPGVVRTDRAEHDLESIFEYLDQQGSDLADRFAEKLGEACVRHARYPHSGPSAEEYAPGLRYFSVWNYAVFYRPIEDGIEIIRILHGSRDLPRFFP